MAKDPSDPDSIVEECKKALISAKGMERGEIYVRMADAYVKMERPAKAAVCYREALESGVETIGLFERYGQLLTNVGEIGEADRVLELGLSKASAIEDKARLLKTRAYIKRNAGSYEESMLLGKKAYDLLKTLHRPSTDVVRVLAEAANIVAISNWEMGRFPECFEWFGKALEQFESIQDHSGMARLRNNLGYLHFQLGDTDKAIDLFQKALEAEEAAETHYGGATVYNNMGLLYMAKGEYEKAEENFKRCIKQGKRSGYVIVVPLAQMNLADMFVEKGEIIKAKTWADLALDGFRKLKERPREAQVLCTMAEIALFEGDLEKATKLAEEAFRMGHDHKAHEAITLSNRVMGMIMATKGDHGTAIKLFRSAIDAHRKAMDHWAMALTLKELARSLKEVGDERGMKDAAEEARAILTRLGSTVELEYMDDLGL